VKFVDQIFGVVGEYMRMYVRPMRSTSAPRGAMRPECFAQERREQLFRGVCSITSNSFIGPLKLQGDPSDLVD
jgi:hypothetical protein